MLAHLRTSCVRPSVRLHIVVPRYDPPRPQWSVRSCQFFGEGMAMRTSEADAVIKATATVACASYCEMLVLHQRQFWQVRMPV